MATIVQGEDKTLTITLDTLNLTSATEITCRFPGSTSVVEKTMTGGAVSLVTAASGIFSVTLTDTDTALLQPGTRATLEIVVDFSSTRRIFQKESAYTVLRRVS